VSNSIEELKELQKSLDAKVEELFPITVSYDNLRSYQPFLETLELRNYWVHGILDHELRFLTWMTNSDQTSSGVWISPLDRESHLSGKGFRKCIQWALRDCALSSTSKIIISKDNKKWLQDLKRYVVKEVSSENK